MRESMRKTIIVCCQAIENLNKPCVLIQTDLTVRIQAITRQYVLMILMNTIRVHIPRLAPGRMLAQAQRICTDEL